MKNSLDELSKNHAIWIGIAFKILKTKEDAQDLVQNLYIEVYKQNISVEKLRNNNYVHGIIKYMAMAVFKNRRYFVHFDLISNRFEIDDQEYSHVNEMLDYMDREIAKLPKRERFLFEIKMYTDLTYEEISNGTDKKVRLISNEKTLDADILRKGTGISHGLLKIIIAEGRKKIKANYYG